MRAIEVIRVKNKHNIPEYAKGASWLWGRVCGYSDGKKAEVFVLPSASKEEIAFAVYHEKAHLIRKDPAVWRGLMAEMMGEAKAWDLTLNLIIKDKKKFTKEQYNKMMREIIRVTRL